LIQILFLNAIPVDKKELLKWYWKPFGGADGMEE